MKKLKRLISIYKNHGVLGVLSSVHAYCFPRKAHCLSQCQQLVTGKIGLEIGGPSNVFANKGILPIYSYIQSLDNCNFSGKTVWEGKIVEGVNYKYDKNRAPGMQYVSDATSLPIDISGKYDFILSSHVIEHIANPFLALTEWMKALRENGTLILIVPHKEGTFDHRRPITSLSHMIDDYQSEIKEDDITHLAEILNLHDLTRDPDAGSYEAFLERSKDNYQNRCLHHHVFNTHLAVKMLDYLGLQFLSAEAILPMHIVLVAKKLPVGQLPDNSEFLDLNAEFLRSSPFKSDQPLTYKVG